MMKYLSYILVTFITQQVLAIKESQMTAKIAELDTSICESLKEPQEENTESLIKDLKLFNSLLKRIRKAIYASKEDHELNGKKITLAEIVTKTHPHFLTLKVDEEKLKSNGKWENRDLRLLQELLQEAQEVKDQLQNLVVNYKKGSS